MDQLTSGKVPGLTTAGAEGSRGTRGVWGQPGGHTPM